MDGRAVPESEKVPVLFLTERVPSMASRNDARGPPHQSFMEVVDSGDLNRFCFVSPRPEGTSLIYRDKLTLMGHVIVHNGPRPYDFGPAFLDDLSGVLEQCNRLLRHARVLTRSRFVVVISVGRGLGQYTCEEMIMSRVMPFVISFKQRFPCAAVLFAGPPVKVRQNVGEVFGASTMREFLNVTCHQFAKLRFYEFIYLFYF
jgi:hypothetical protein